MVFLSIITCPNKIRYRLDFVHTGCNVYRWTYWIFELLNLPVVTMLVWAGSCSFETIREGFKLEITTFEKIDETWGEQYKWGIFGAAIVGVIVGHVHNIILFSIVQK